jgi:peptidyl-prolyl cis-trans isomerase C
MCVRAVGPLAHWHADSLTHALTRSPVPLLLCLLAFASCGKRDDSHVLATVGQRPITVADFQREVERRVNARRPVPDKETLLQEMVAYEALLQRAQKAGVADDPQTQREINNLLISRMQERELSPRVAEVSVTPEDVAAYYEKNLAKYTRPAKARLAILFLEANPTMTDAKRAELRERLMEARAKIIESPAPGGRGPAAIGFGALAIEYSEEQTSRYRGGDIGWLDTPSQTGSLPSRWPREVLEAGFALEQRRVSDLVETAGGFYLVMNTDFRQSAVTPLVELAPTIQQSLLVQKRREAEEAFRAKTIRLAGTTVNQAALAGLKLSLPATVAQHRESGPPGFPMTTDE